MRRGPKGGDVRDMLQRLAGWVSGRLRFIMYRIRQARALRRARDDDPNNYPLW
jgi:hypothetical protein